MLFSLKGSLNEEKQKPGLHPGRRKQDPAVGSREARSNCSGLLMANV